ncbi:unnamed protein product [Victoria cruziana]
MNHEPKSKEKRNFFTPPSVLASRFLHSLVLGYSRRLSREATGRWASFPSLWYLWEFEKIGEGFVSVSIQVSELEARGFGFLTVDRVPYSSSDSDLKLRFT